MRRDDELLSAAIQVLQTGQPDAALLSASASRVASRLGIDEVGDSTVGIIEDCGDVQQLLIPYRAGSLSSVRWLLIEAHLRDCSACRSRYRSVPGNAVVDWSPPAPTGGFVWRPRAWGWALAPALVLLFCLPFSYKAYWQVPPGVRAEVQSIDGTAYRISTSGNRQLAPGDKLTEGEHLRTSGGAHAVLRLSDGSTVEVNERSVLEVGARGHNMTLTLDNGAVIVQAFKRTSGHLYVKTPDCRVAVTGTVFSVNSGIKGSRVAVFQGAVHVSHAGIDSLLHAGDQVATNDNLSPMPVGQQIAWSQDREKYLVLLAQFAALQHRIEQIPLPQLRYASDLLDRVPSDTLLYISIPNLGEFVSEANRIFHDQLNESAALQQWWGQGHENNTADLDGMVEKLHQMSRYLGEEIVVVAVKQPHNPGFAIVAAVTRAGLDDFLRSQFPTTGSSPGLIVFDQSSLAAASSAGKAEKGQYALLRPQQVIISNNIATLKQMNNQLNRGASGFARGEFGQQITAAYSRGAGFILAADVHQMIESRSMQKRSESASRAANTDSGLEDVRYLIAEHREVNGLPRNHLSLQFSGARQRVASWLAAPAPIGSLNFVTPNAALAVALLSKDPRAIADDILTMAESDKEGHKGWSEAESKLRINLREDLAANLGGDFLVSIDGPILPTPSWKAVIEVHSSERLQQTLERVAESTRNQAQGKEHAIAIESNEVGSQRFYRVRDMTTGSAVAHYTFADGYMIVAPSRALLMEALRTHASGDSLAHSAAFKALLPRDENENYSAIVYQNVSPVLTPLLSQFNGESTAVLRKFAADARPTAVCVWGKESRIEAASDSQLFGFDFLTLGALIDSRNKHAQPGVHN